MRVPFTNANVGLGTGVAIGAAAFFLAPVVVPVVTGVLKSLTKAGIKGGMILYDKGRVAVEEAKETIEDLTAEAKSELQPDSKPATGAKTKKAA
jgi:hypothetical protein